MYDIINYVERINCLNHKRLSEYLKNKLLSVDLRDITHTVFFKKLYVILQNLTQHLRELNMKINESKEHLVRFCSHLHDNQYIHDTCGFIQINLRKINK